MGRRVVFLMMWTFLGIVAGYFVAVYLLCHPGNLTGYLYCSEVEKLADYYEKNLRGHLFAAFLALGGFLLSLKTFIVVTMKENVYDSDKYKKNFKDKQKLNSSLKLYAPLQELSDLLFYAILASIISALLQMTIGLYPYWVAAMIAISSSIFAMVLLLASLHLIKRNLDGWFENLHGEDVL